VINNELGIPKNEYKDYNVVLVIPDIYDKVYVTELISLLLKEMNFKAIIVQQVSYEKIYIYINKQTTNKKSNNIIFIFL